MINAPLSDLRGEHGTKPVPPEPHCLVANIYAALKQQVFDLAERQWIAHVHHDRQADYPG